MSETKKSVGIMSRRRRMVYFSTVFEVYTARQSPDVHLLIAAARRRGTPLARCWLRRPAVQLARLVRAGWAQTLARGVPRRRRRASQTFWRLSLEKERGPAFQPALCSVPL